MPLKKETKRNSVYRWRRTLLTGITASAIREIMGSGQQTYTHFELLQEVKKKYEVYHISVLHSDQAVRADRGWKELLGENCISIEDHREIPMLSKGIICDKYKNQNSGMTGPDGFDAIQML
jgi:hypothetical protein